MLEEKVLNTIKKYELIEKGNTIVIGVSGGPDSMALLNVLIKLNEKSGLGIDINEEVLTQLTIHNDRLQ